MATDGSHYSQDPRTYDFLKPGRLNILYGTVNPVYGTVGKRGCICKCSAYIYITQTSLRVNSKNIK